MALVAPVHLWRASPRASSPIRLIRILSASFLLLSRCRRALQHTLCVARNKLGSRHARGAAAARNHDTKKGPSAGLLVVLLLVLLFVLLLLILLLGVLLLVLGGVFLRRVLLRGVRIGSAGNTQERSERQST